MKCAQFEVNEENMRYHELQANEVSIVRRLLEVSSRSAMKNSQFEVN